MLFLAIRQLIERTVNTVLNLIEGVVREALTAGKVVNGIKRGQAAAGLLTDEISGVQTLTGAARPMGCLPVLLRQVLPRVLIRAFPYAVGLLVVAIVIKVALLPLLRVAKKPDMPQPQLEQTADDFRDIREPRMQSRPEPTVNSRPTPTPAPRTRVRERINSEAITQPRKQRGSRVHGDAELNEPRIIFHDEP